MEQCLKYKKYKEYKKYIKITKILQEHTQKYQIILIK